MLYRVVDLRVWAVFQNVNQPQNFYLRTVPPTVQKYFLRSFFDYAGKADLCMGYWNPERKLGVAGHF